MSDYRRPIGGEPSSTWMAYIEQLERKAERAGILLSPDSGFDLLDERDKYKRMAEWLADRLGLDYIGVPSTTGEEMLAGYWLRAAEEATRDE